jgi:hypothetical protein
MSTSSRPSVVAAALLGYRPGESQAAEPVAVPKRHVSRWKRAIAEEIKAGASILSTCDRTGLSQEAVELILRQVEGTESKVSAGAIPSRRTVYTDEDVARFHEPEPRLCFQRFDFHDPDDVD